MSGNSTSLYTAVSSSNGTTTSNNFTTLYPNAQGVIVPTTQYGNANVVALLAAGSDGGNTIANIVATGNISGNYFLGNGSQLTGLPATYGNANVAAFLPVYGGNVNAEAVFGQGLAVQGYDFVQMQYSNAATLPLSQYDIATGSWFYLDSGGATFQSNTTGTIRQVVLGNDGSVNAVGNVTGNYILGDGSQLTNLPAGNYSNSNVVSLLASFGSNVVSTTGNITGGYFIGDGSQLTNLPAGNYSNSNVVSLMANFGSNVITTTGNITGGYILGNGSQLTGLPATYGNANVVANLAALGSNPVSTTGNITAGYFFGNGSQLTGVVATGIGTLTSLSVTGNIQTGNLNTAGQVSAGGNVTGAYIVGNGSALTNLTGANVTGTVANATYATSAGSASTADLAQYVTGNAQANITSVGILSSLSVSGNVTASYYSGNGSQLTGIVSDYGNSNVATYLASGTNTQDIITSGTVQGNLLTTAGASGNIIGVNYVSANYYLGNGSFLTGVVATGVGTLANLSVTGNIQTGNLLTNGLVSAAGNITGGNITLSTAVGNIYGHDITLGGGAYITGVVSAVGNVRGGNINTGGIVTATGNVYGNYFVGNGSLLTSITGANVTGTVANATYATTAGSATTATTAGTVTANAQANITSVGVLTSLSVSGNTQSGNLLTVGLVSATGNVTGAYIIGNGSQLTGLPAGYSNADVTTLLANFGSNSISTTGNITASYFVGNGSLLSSITGANVTGTVANATYATSAGTATSATTAGTVTSNAQANITSVGTLTSLSVSGNTQSGNLLTAGVVSATGNITGSYFIGNGSALTGISASPGGSNTQIQFNNASAFAGNAAMTFDVTTGNIGMGNLILSSGNITNRINTIAPFNGNPANATAFGNSQILIGNGWNGNIALAAQVATSPRGAKFLVSDTANIADSGGPRYAGIAAASYLILSGNVSNVNTNLRGGIFAAYVGGSSSNYQLQTTGQGSVAGGTIFLSVGQPNTAVALGNTTVYSGSGLTAQITTQSGSSIGNAAPIVSIYSGNGNVTNLAGLALNFNAFPSNTPTNVYGLYMNSSTTNGIFGNLVNQDPMRSATNYYFLRNDDDVAQVKLGSLRLFNEFQYDGANTSGTLAVDKNNGQVQTVYLSGAVTSVTFSNFVTSASNGSTTKYQTDTVTLILRQGSTGYAVTMPTGTAYKYAANTTAVGTTANSVTMISVTATYDSVSAANQYLITISPEFT